MLKPPHLLFEHLLCAGDTVAMSVVPREVYRATGGKVRVSVRTNHPAVFENSPFVKHNLSAKCPAPPGTMLCPLSYDPKKGCKNRMHFLQAFLASADPYVRPYLERPLRLTEFRPSIQLAPDEQSTMPRLPGMPRDTPYWLVMAGGKHDIKTKLWAPRRWRQVVYDLAQDTDFPVIAQVGVTSTGHTHRPLPGCVNLLDKTDLRALIWLARHARGVICGVTSLMHIAAAVGTPAIVIAGGREPWWWDSYDTRAQELFRPAEQLAFAPHVYLDGGAARCTNDGCWNTGYYGSGAKNCKHLLPADRLSRSIPQPACMDAITPQMIIACARGMDRQIGTGMGGSGE